MGHESAYTGKEVSYEEIMNSGMKPGPDEITPGSVNRPIEILKPGITQV